MIQLDLNKPIAWIKRALPWILLIAVALAWFHCSSEYRKTIDNKERNLSILKKDSTSQVARLKKIEGEKQVWTAEREVYQVTQKELKEQVWMKDENIKQLIKGFDKIQSVIKGSAVVSIDTMYLPFDRPAPCEFNFTKEYAPSKWWTVKINSTQLGNTIQSIKGTTDVYAVTGFDRKSIFHPYEGKISLTSSNPDIKFNFIEGQVVTEPKSFWDNLLLWAGAGGIIGFLLGTL